jgi:hypothetical protein
LISIDDNKSWILGYENKNNFTPVYPIISLCGKFIMYRLSTRNEYYYSKITIENNAIKLGVINCLDNFERSDIIKIVQSRDHIIFSVRASASGAIQNKFVFYDALTLKKIRIEDIHYNIVDICANSEYLFILHKVTSNNDKLCVNIYDLKKISKNQILIDYLIASVYIDSELFRGTINGTFSGMDASDKYFVLCYSDGLLICGL